jgi:hypothetical protein
MRGPSSDKEPLLNEIESFANNLVPYGKDIEVIKIRVSCRGARFRNSHN